MSDREIGQSRIQEIPTDKLTAFDRNARTHTPQQIELIARSIERFGFTNPVLVDATGMIIAGHGRVLAAKKLGIPRVPVIALAHLTPAQVRAYVIADNKIAQLSGWDDEMLRSEISDLRALGEDVNITGFTDDEITTLMEGWSVPDKAITVHGEHTDGIPAVMRVIVDAEKEKAARATITEALTAAGIAAEVR